MLTLKLIMWSVEIKNELHQRVIKSLDYFSDVTETLRDGNADNILSARLSKQRMLQPLSQRLRSMSQLLVEWSYPCTSPERLYLSTTRVPRCRAHFLTRPGLLLPRRRGRPSIFWGIMAGHIRGPGIKGDEVGFSMVSNITYTLPFLYFELTILFYWR